jgi:hypothetical protein
LEPPLAGIIAIIKILKKKFKLSKNSPY